MFIFKRTSVHFILIFIKWHACTRRHVEKVPISHAKVHSTLNRQVWKPLLSVPHLWISVFGFILCCVLCVLHSSFLFSVPSLSLSLLTRLRHFCSFLSLLVLHFLSWLLCGSDLKDIHNSQHRYLLASENQRPGHLSTAPMGSLTASPSSGSLCSPAGLQSVCSIQERIMSTPGGEEAIERLKVRRHEHPRLLMPSDVMMYDDKKNRIYWPWFRIVFLNILLIIISLDGQMSTEATILCLFIWIHQIPQQ